MKTFEEIFESAVPARDKFLSRLFGIFSEEAVRIWAGDESSPYEDLGRPTIYPQQGQRGHTLDFTLRRRSDGKVYVAEMKCELEYESYKYLRLTTPRQLDHHKSKSFRAFLQISRNPRGIPVRVGGRSISVSGGILVWGAATADGSLATKREFHLADVLSLEEIIRTVRSSRNWIERIEMIRTWGNELFDALQGI